MIKHCPICKEELLIKDASQSPFVGFEFRECEKKCYLISYRVNGIRKLVDEYCIYNHNNLIFRINLFNGRFSKIDIYSDNFYKLILSFKINKISFIDESITLDKVIKKIDKLMLVA